MIILIMMMMRRRMGMNRKGFFFLIIYKMSYYQFNRQEILQKAKERYSKEKAAEYYLQNEEAIKKRQKNVIKTCHKKEKVKLKSTKKRDIKNWFSIKKKR